MRRLALCAALGSALAAGSAGAATLELGLSAVGGPMTGAVTGSGSGFGARLGVSEVDFAGGQLAAGVSGRALDLRYGRGLALPPLGAVTADATLAVTWAGGVRAGARVSGGLGPVALNVGGTVFTTSAASVDPLSVWSFTPTDTRASGWNADVTARYRVSRTLVAVGGAEFGAQNVGVLGLEGRRDLTRVFPPEPDAGAQADDPQDEPLPEPLPPETETTGTLTWRVGARAGQDVLGITGGASYATPEGLTLGVDALLGAGQVGTGQLGLTASLSAPDLFGEGSALRVYSAYEPWRAASLPLRLGVESSLPLGPGTLGVDVRGGRDALGTPGYGVRVSYQLPLGLPASP